MKKENTILTGFLDVLSDLRNEIETINKGILVTMQRYSILEFSGNATPEEQMNSELSNITNQLEDTIKKIKKEQDK